MPIPPNISAETAASLDPGDSFTLDVSEVVDPLHTVWYFHEVTTAGTSLSVWAKSDEGANYQPNCRTYTGTPGDLTVYRQAGDNTPFLIPLALGTIYYFEVWNGGVDPITTDLQISAVAAPTEFVPAGSIAVNDDFAGMPLVLFSSSGSVVRQVSTFPDGEGGYILNDGTLLIEDFEHARLSLYNDQYELMAAVAYPAGYVGRAGAIGGDVFTAFLVGMQINGEVFTVSNTGVVTEAGWDLGNVTTIMWSMDQSIVYYTGGGSSVSAAVKRASFPDGGALSNLAAGETNYFVMEIQVLTDDTILVAYHRSTGTDDNFVRQYSAAGAILHQYAFGLEQINRMTLGVDGVSTFWVWFYTGNGFSRFSEIRVSDGAVLNSFETPTYVDGVCDVTGEEFSEEMRFGVPFSCPFWITHADFPADEPPDETPGTETDPIRWLRRAPVISDENTRLFHTQFTLDMQTGTGLVSGQGSDPQVMLRYSDDSGQTWSEEHWRGSGKIGEDPRRVIWRRLGASRNRVYELVGSDPVVVGLIDGYTDVSKGSN